MIEPTVSVIIVSRGRPDSLRRCLTAASQLIYRLFEVVSVVDPAAAAAVRGMPFADRIKIVEFDEANISLARNEGLAHAAGEIVAFLDDDAVPEPGWLCHLVQAFADPDVAAAGGYVRGRNGISFQSKGQAVDEFGYTTVLPLSSDDIEVFSGRPGMAIKTQGTNCAFRRDIFCEIGGFDPAYRYYLDETDLNMRLAVQNRKTAIVPRAEVHHGVEASATRKKSRMPRSLLEVGASQVIFLRKYAPDAERDAVIEDFCGIQRRLLIRHLVAGNCEPRDVERVMTTLRAGISEGSGRAISPAPAIPRKDRDFRRFRQASAYYRHEVICGFRSRAPGLRRMARESVRQGAIVSLYIFSATSRYHRVSYSDGHWEQKGGLFGRSERSGPFFLFTGLKQRLKKETHRVASQRDPRNTAHLVGLLSKNTL